MPSTMVDSAASLLERIGTQSFDDLAALAAQLCGTHTAAIFLFDTEASTVTSSSADAPVRAALRDAAMAASAAANGLAHTAAEGPAGVTTCAVSVETPSGEGLGAVAVAFAGPRQISDGDIRGLRRLSRHTGALIEQARLSGERLVRQARLRGMVQTFDVEDERKTSLAAAIHGMPDPVALADRHGVLRYMNPAARALLPGAQETEQTLRGLHSPDQRLTYDSAVLEALRDGVWTGESTLVGSGGARVAISETLIAIPGGAGEAEGLVMVARDVSEFTRQQTQLRQSEGRFRHLVEDVDDVLFEQDPSGRWTFLNASWTRATGFSVQESVGRQYTEFVHPDDAAASRARRAGLIQEGRHDGVHAARYITKAGNWRWLEARVRRNVGPNGEVVGTVGTLRDVTVRIEMSEELAKAQDEALRSTALMPEFLATVSHEIRTPLNGVLGLMTILQDTPLNDDQRAIASSAQRSAEALLTLVNDILDISKLEADRLTIDSVPFDLHGWAREVTAPSFARAQAKNLGTQLTVDPKLPERMTGDPTRCRQILANLLDNAVKFTDQGRVTVEVSPTVSAEGRPMVRIAVTDSGIGIPPEKQGLVFEKYRQADASTTRRYGGTGLGLAICRQLATRMEGAVGVQSDVGTGSTFWFTIPLVAAVSTEPVDAVAPTAPAEATTGAQPQPPAQPQPQSAPLVLLVEDNPTNQFVARRLLEKAGCRVEIVNNGAEALDRLLTQTYGVVFMDCQMPVMDGYEATRRIRQLDGPVASIPIVAMTAHAMAGDREKCLETGMSDYVSKPLKPEILIAALRRALGQTPDKPAGAK
jgi:PAS domain S-box-containing protein